jgi:hypothetical protein
MTTPLDAALSYAELGWSVFPLKRNKEPLTEHGHRDATTDEEQIRAWFTDADINVGVWLRQSGLIAIDVDPRNGGDVTLAALERTYGDLPRDCLARSGAGGLHIVMRDPGGRPRGRLDHVGLGRGVDVKCNGYILVEPSVNEGGGRYEWLSCEAPPAVPEAWLAILLHPDASGDAPEIERWALSSDETLALDDAAALRATLKAIGPRRAGGKTTFRAIRSVFHDYGLSVEEGWPFLLEWNAACGAPRDDADLQRAVERAASVSDDPTWGKRGHARPGLSLGERVARAGIREEVASVRVVAPPSALARLFAGQPTTELPATPTADAGTYAHALQEACIAVEHYVGASFGGDDEEQFFAPAWELFTRVYPPTPWLIKNLAVEGGIVVIGGPPKAGKTWHACDMSFGLATGTDVFGRFAVPRARSGAYFCTEDLAQSFRNRLRAFARARGLEPTEQGFRRLSVQPRGRMIDVTKPETCARLIASARMIEERNGEKLGFIVLDPLRNTHGGDENDSTAMRDAFEAIKMIGTLVGCTMIIPHHMRKLDRKGASGGRPGERLRGSNAIHGFIDSGIFLDEAEGGDGVTVFVNEITSEIKSARSAGKFELKLTIEDNADGEAINARWNDGKRGETTATPDTVDSWQELALVMCETMLIAELKSAPLRTQTHVTGAVKGAGNAAKVIAFSKALGQGWISRSGSAGNCKLTPEGRKLAQERLSAPSSAAPEIASSAPSSVSAFLK